MHHIRTYYIKLNYKEMFKWFSSSWVMYKPVQLRTWHANCTAKYICYIALLKYIVHNGLKCLVPKYIEILYIAIVHENTQGLVYIPSNSGSNGIQIITRKVFLFLWALAIFARVWSITVFFTPWSTSDEIKNWFCWKKNSISTISKFERARGHCPLTYSFPPQQRYIIQHFAIKENYYLWKTVKFNLCSNTGIGHKHNYKNCVRYLQHFVKFVAVNKILL